MADITQAQADAILNQAREAARETGTAMNITVVDAGGNLKAFTRTVLRYGDRLDRGTFAAGRPPVQH
jgi:hypothetical protein